VWNGVKMFIMAKGFFREVGDSMRLSGWIFIKQVGIKK